MEAPKDSIAFQAGEDDKAQGTAGADVHLVEAKDHFSELGTFSISGRLAFQGPDIDPYLWFPPSSRCCKRDEGARGFAGAGTFGG